MRTLDSYGMKWMGTVPDNWSIFPTKRHFDIQLGKMLQNAPEADDDCAVPYLKAVNVLWGRVNTEDAPEMWASPDEIMSYEVRDGDLLVCEGGEVGRAGIVRNPPDRCIIQNALHRVRARNSSSVSFLMYVLHSVDSSGWFDVLCNKATIAHFTGEKFAELRIPLPSPKTQKAVATFLDCETSRIEELIAKKQCQIELLQEKRSALISHVVTKGLDPDVKMKDSGVEWLGEIPEHWDIARFKYALWLQRGHDLPAAEFCEGEYPVCGSNGCIGYHSLFTTRGPGVTVGRSGSVGEVNYIDTDYWAHNTALYVKEFRQVIPRYSYYLLKTLDVKYLSEGTAVGTLNRNYIHELRIPVPTIAQQQSIAAFLDQETSRIDELIAKVSKSIDLLREYRTALISAAVTGKIDVREEVA